MSDVPREPAPQPASARGGTSDAQARTPLLVDAKAAATMLAISPRTLWHLTKRSALPHRRIGRLVRYAPDELQEWVAAGCPTGLDSAKRVRDAMSREVS